MTTDATTTRACCPYCGAGPMTGAAFEQHHAEGCADDPALCWDCGIRPATTRRGQCDTCYLTDNV